ncbi:MAG: ATP-binding protein [Burkholderiaceae bacterium]
MDPVRNPFAPGAGSRPPELAGRDDLLETARIAIERTRLGKSTKSVVLVGLRGVGKTVLLDKIRERAEHDGVVTARIEAPEGRSLPSILAPQLRLVLLALSRFEKAKALSTRALHGLAGFVGALKVKYGDIEVAVDLPVEKGLADNGDLEHDLQDLFEAVGLAAQADGKAVALFIDELQYVKPEQLAALITACHRISQRQLPLIVIGAGLPQLRGLMGDSKSYSERLFEFPSIGPLPETAARVALQKPCIDEGAAMDDDAVNEIIIRTRGYPYFLQEWGSHSWNAAAKSPISLADVRNASDIALAAMDESFFLVRFDRLTPLEKRYLRAMAEIGEGPHRSGDVAEELGRQVQSLGPTRSSLIRKGMIWSPNHGDTAFTVPLFDQFMKRIMPGDAWRG